MATVACTSARLPPISVTSAIGSTSVLDIKKMCWIDNAARTDSGGLSSSP